MTTGRFGVARELASNRRVLIACSAGAALGAATIPFNILGALVDPLRAEFGWNRSDIQLSFLWFTVAAAVGIPAAGALADRFGSRPVAITSGVLFVVALGAIAAAGSSLATYQALWALMGLAGAGTTPVVWGRLITLWFEANRGLALATMLTAVGLMGATLQLLSTWLVDAIGWRQMLLCVAAAAAGALPPVWKFAKEPQRRAGHARDKSPISSGIPAGVRDRRFWTMLAAIVLISPPVAGIIANLKPIMADLRFAPATAAQVAATFGLSAAVGRLVFGYLIDRYWAPGVSLPFLLLPVFGSVLLANGTDAVAYFFIAATLIGIAAGCETDLLAYLTGRYFRLIEYGRLYGLFFAGFSVSAGAAPFLFAKLYESTGDYALLLHICAAMFGAGALLILSLGRYPASAEAVPPTSREADAGALLTDRA